jgi:hypothetical protein
MRRTFEGGVVTPWGMPRRPAVESASDDAISHATGDGSIPITVLRRAR